MKKYKVTQKFMEELTEWRHEYATKFDIVRLSYHTLEALPEIAEIWWTDNNPKEANKRITAIFDWTSGEDVFEVGTPKYVVQRKNVNFLVGNEYLSIDNYSAIHITRDKEKATRFDDFEEASGWANEHFEVVEVDE